MDILLSINHQLQLFVRGKSHLSRCLGVSSFTSHKHTHCLHPHMYTHRRVVHAALYNCTHASLSAQCEEPSVSSHSSKGIGMTPSRALLNANNIMCVTWLSNENELRNRLHFTNCTNIRRNRCTLTHTLQLPVFLQLQASSTMQIHFTLCSFFVKDIHKKDILALWYCLLADLGASHRCRHRNS